MKLVLDTAAFIAGNVIFDPSVEYYTIPEVIDEIKDKISIQTLDRSLLIFKYPSKDAIDAVVAFSKKTGDFASLSATDLKVLALTWMLEKEVYNGVGHLRTNPLPPKPFVPKSFSQENSDETTQTSFFDQQSPTEEDSSSDLIGEKFSSLNFWKSSLPVIDFDLFVLNGNENSLENLNILQGDEYSFNDFSFWKQDLPSIDFDQMDIGGELINELEEFHEEDFDQENDDEKEVDGDLQEEGFDKENEEKEEEDDGFQTVSYSKTQKHQKNPKKSSLLPGWVNNSDDETWITPANIQKFNPNSVAPQNGQQPQKKKKQYKKKKQNFKVACVTSDFAMQNVLLQMKMKLSAIDGRRITNLKTFVLRCHGCFKTTIKMESKFCPTCGGNTLIKTSVGIDNEGNQILYLKKNFQYNNRGTKYAIPVFKGGRKNNDLFLREDQRDYQKAVRTLNYAKRKGKKTSADLFDADYVPLDSMGKFVNARGPSIGYGRTNVNQAKRKVT